MTSGSDFQIRIVRDLARRRRVVQLPVGRDKAASVRRLGLFHGLSNASLEFIAQATNQIDPLRRDSNEHLTAVINGVGSFHVAELLQPIDEPCGSGGGVPHLAGNVRHGQLLRGREVAEKEKLSERDIVLIQVPREIQQELTLAEQDEIRQLCGIAGREFGSVES